MVIGNWLLVVDRIFILGKELSIERNPKL